MKKLKKLSLENEMKKEAEQIEKKETPQERLKRIMNRQLNKQSKS